MALSAGASAASQSDGLKGPKTVPDHENNRPIEWVLDMMKGWFSLVGNLVSFTKIAGRFHPMEYLSESGVVTI